MTYRTAHRALRPVTRFRTLLVLAVAGMFAVTACSSSSSSSGTKSGTLQLWLGGGTDQAASYLEPAPRRLPHPEVKGHPAHVLR
jgi:hypothetical protein